MRNIKRTLSLMLVCILSLGLFTACTVTSKTDGYSVVRSLGASSSIQEDSDLNEIASITSQYKRGVITESTYNQKLASLTSSLNKKNISIKVTAIGEDTSSEDTALSNAKANASGVSASDMKYYGYCSGYTSNWCVVIVMAQ